MQDQQVIDWVPLWAVFVGSVVIVLLSIRGGYQLARASRKRAAEDDAPVGSVISASLGLLAFMLAFTFSVAVARRDTRRELVLDDANAIGTTYLRADLIPEPHRSGVRALLTRYVDIRVDVVANPGQLQSAVEESKAIHGRLWAHAAALRDAALPNPDIASLFIESLNEVIDLHTKRMTIIHHRVPEVLWLFLGALTVLSMATVGYQFGRKGGYNWPINLALAMSFSVVILLIADLDRVSGGWLKVSQRPMVELQADLRAP